MQPAPLVLFFRAAALPGLHAIASDLFRSSTRHEDEPPSNQTTEFTEEHRGISKNRFRIPLWTLCPLWFNPSLDQSSTTNRASPPLRLFARTELRDSHAPSAMPIFWDRMLNPCQRTPFTWVTAWLTPAYIVFQPIGSCNQPSIKLSAKGPIARMISSESNHRTVKSDLSLQKRASAVSHASCCYIRTGRLLA
jgi:hypothetical protein